MSLLCPTGSKEYESKIESSQHGYDYQKHLALIQWLRMTRAKRDFELAYEMTKALRFDDIVLQVDERLIFVQVKHAIVKNSACPPCIESEGLFPKYNNREKKGDFNMFKYLKSYLIVKSDFDGEKAFNIFTNRELADSDELRRWVSIENRQVDETLQFGTGRHVGLQPTEFAIKKMLEFMNNDFHALKDAIKDLFKQGTVSTILTDYKAPLEAVLEENNGQIKFANTFKEDSTDCRIAALCRALKQELDIDKSVIQKNNIFIGKNSNRKFLPLFVKEDDIRQFFKDLTLIVRQPDDLRPELDNELRLWMGTWMRTDIFGKLDKSDEDKAFEVVDKCFDTSRKPEPTAEKRQLINKLPDDECSQQIRNGLKVRYPELEDQENFYVNRKIVVINNSSSSDDPPKTILLDNVQQEKQVEAKSSLQSFTESSCNKPTVVNTDMINANETETISHDTTAMNNNNATVQLEGNFPLKGSDIVLNEQSNETDDTKLHNRATISDQQLVKELTGKFSSCKCLVLTTEPGMGKTNLLQYVALEKQKRNDSSVFLVYLDRLVSKLDKEISEIQDVFHVLDAALSERSCSIIRKAIESTDRVKNRIIILFDAFDEVHSKYKDRVLKMLELLLAQECMQIVVSGRTHIEDSLLERLGRERCKLMSLEPFDKTDHYEFLKKVWNISAKNVLFDKYSALLLEKFRSSVHRNLQDITGVPLMSKMLADIFKERFEKFSICSEVERQEEKERISKETFSMVYIMKSFVEKSLQMKMKMQNLYENDHNKLLDSLTIGFYQEHLYLAMEIVDVEELRGKLKNPSVKKGLEKIKERCKDGKEKSLLIKIVDGKVQFTHFSIGEYFIAKYLFDHINDHKEYILEILSRHDVIRKYAMMIIEQHIVEEQKINEDEDDDGVLDILSKTVTPFWACQSNCIELLKRVIKGCDIKSLCHPKHRTLLHAAAEGGYPAICSFLIDVHGAEVNRLYDGLAPIHLAAHEGNLDVVNLLLDKAANLNVRTHRGWSVLHYAAYNNHTHIVQYLIGKGVDLNVLEDRKWTALHFAAQNGHCEMLNFLISKNASLDVLEEKGQTALHIAASKGQTRCVELLLAKKIDIDQQEHKGWTALHFAAQIGNVDIARHLIQKQANWEALTKNNWTALHIAVLGDHVETVKLLLQNKANPEAMETNGRTPLHIAAGKGHHRVVELLLAANANHKAKANKSLTALHFAADGGHEGVVRQLISKNVDLEARDNQQWTAIHFAVQKGHSEVFDVLVENKACVNAETNIGKTALHIAAGMGHTEMVKVLLREKANVNIRTLRGWTALHMAAEENHLQVMELLIASSANLEIRDNKGYTALHFAAAGGHLEAVQFLISKNAELNARENRSWTALHLAAQNGHKSVVQFLADKKVDMNIPEEDGYTALHIATFNGHAEVVDVLVSNDANLELMDKDGWTALHFAAYRSSVEIAKMLLKQKSKCNAKEHNGKTALHIAAEKGSVDVVTLLLNHDADVDARENNLRTLCCAALGGHATIVDLLLKHNAKKNASDGRGWSALHFACNKGYKEVVDLADIMITDNRKWTPLHFAAQNGHVEIVKLLLLKGADANARENDGLTALHIASQNGHEPVVQELLRVEANAEIRSKSGRTALHFAAICGRTNIVRLLAPAMNDLTISNDRGWTVLHYAADNDHLDTLKLLIEEFGLEPDVRCVRGWTSLHYAGAKGHENTLRFLMEHNINLESRDNRGWTVLHLAAQNGHLNIIKLLEQKADLHALTSGGLNAAIIAAFKGHVDILKLLISKQVNLEHLDENRWNALFFAVDKGHEIVELLISANVNLNVQTTKGTTCLHRAAEKGYTTIASLLITKGADLEIEEENRWTALHFAAQNGHIGIVELLLQKKVNVDAAVKEGRTPLHMASHNNHTQVVMMLIEANAKVELQMSSGKTALHIAAARGNHSTVETLITNKVKKANIEALDDMRYTALHLASQNGHTSTVQQLIECGANIEARVEDGWTPLHFAFHKGHRNVLKFLLEKGANIETRDYRGRTARDIANPRLKFEDLFPEKTVMNCSRLEMQ